MKRRPAEISPGKKATDTEEHFFSFDSGLILTQMFEFVRRSRNLQVVLACGFFIILLILYIPLQSESQVMLRQLTMDEVVVVHRTRFFEVDGNPINLFYLEAMPEMQPDVETVLRVPVLLLHGAAFTSKIWSDTHTLQLIASLGHRAIAVDLPGYGRTAAPDNLDPFQFMAQLIYELRLGRPIIVAPSLGGKYALAYLLQEPESAAQRSRGLMAVAPVGFEKFTAEKFSECTTSTWFVFGEEDRKIAPRSLAKFKNVPGLEVRQMSEAGHACYVDDPEAWHALLKQFIHQIDKEVLRSPY